jgi:hypothetical protein
MVLLPLCSMFVRFHATVLPLPFAPKLPDDHKIMHDLAVVTPCLEFLLNTSPDLCWSLACLLLSYVVHACYAAYAYWYPILACLGV